MHVQIVWVTVSYRRSLSKVGGMHETKRCPKGFIAVIVLCETPIGHIRRIWEEVQFGPRQHMITVLELGDRDNEPLTPFHHSSLNQCQFSTRHSLDDLPLDVVRKIDSLARQAERLSTMVFSGETEDFLSQLHSDAGQAELLEDVSCSWSWNRCIDRKGT